MEEREGLKERVLAEVVRFYLSSDDFNGCSLSRLDPFGERADLLNVLRDLIDSEQIHVMSEATSVNPHIRRLDVPPKEAQLGLLREALSPHHTCFYPDASVLANNIDAGRYGGKPFDELMARGQNQFDFCFFDLSLLEFYRNDPRYIYYCDDVTGSISVSNEFYRSDSMPESDQILIESFGFAYNEQRGRVVAAPLRYLAQLSPEHQQIWRAKQFQGEQFDVHPVYVQTQIVGEWPDTVPVFDAFMMEVSIVNQMTTAIWGRTIFRVTEKTKKFGFLVRPTKHEFGSFVHLLDKLLSDNLQKSFFKGTVAMEDEIPRGEGKVELRQKGTIRLLEEWLAKNFRPKDVGPINDMIGTFKKVRALRQPQAHGVDDDTFDPKYFHEQRDLILQAYSAVRFLRLALANHPKAAGVDVPKDLFESRVYAY